MERKTEDVVIRTWEMEAGGYRNIGRPKLRERFYKKRHEGETSKYIRRWRTWILNNRCANSNRGRPFEEDEEEEDETCNCRFRFR